MKSPFNAVQDLALLDLCTALPAIETTRGSPTWRRSYLVLDTVAPTPRSIESIRLLAWQLLLWAANAGAMALALATHAALLPSKLARRRNLNHGRAWLHPMLPAQHPSSRSRTVDALPRLRRFLEAMEDMCLFQIQRRDAALHAYHRLAAYWVRSLVEPTLSGLPRQWRIHSPYELNSQASSQACAKIAHSLAQEGLDLEHWATGLLNSTLLLEDFIDTEHTWQACGYHPTWSPSRLLPSYVELFFACSELACSQSSEFHAVQSRARILFTRSEKDAIVQSLGDAPAPSLPRRSRL